MDSLRIMLFVLTCAQPLLGDSIVKEGANSSDITWNQTPPVEVPLHQKPRTSRTLLKKLHNGVAFLTGVKLGAILSNKGFDLGHGSLSSSHSFQLFGKSVNSALSLSYGDVAPLLPLVDDVTQNGSYSVEEANKALKDGENIIHVTVIQNPTAETFDKLKTISPSWTENSEDATRVDTEENSIDQDTKKEDPVLYQDETAKAVEGNQQKSNFLREHNRRVQEFNNLTRRANSKF